MHLVFLDEVKRSEPLSVLGLQQLIVERVEKIVKCQHVVALVVLAVVLAARAKLDAQVKQIVLFSRRQNRNVRLVLYHQSHSLEKIIVLMRVGLELERQQYEHERRVALNVDLQHRVLHLERERFLHCFEVDIRLL